MEICRRCNQKKSLVEANKVYPICQDCLDFEEKRKIYPKEKTNAN